VSAQTYDANLVDVVVDFRAGTVRIVHTLSSGDDEDPPSVRMTLAELEQRLLDLR
jgi:hypothetical protein